MSTIKVGCEVFVERNNHILLGKRINCTGAGTWGLPGGHLEYGERLIDGARRELFEEVGIIAQSLELVAITDSIDDVRHYVHATFLLGSFSGTIVNKEPDKCQTWQFFPLTQLPEPLFDPHVRIIQAFSSKKLYLID